MLNSGWAYLRASLNACFSRRTDCSGRAGMPSRGTNLAALLCAALPLRIATIRWSNGAVLDSGWADWTGLGLGRAGSRANSQ